MKYVLLIVATIFFLMVPVTAVTSTVEISADITSVPVYIDGDFTGVTPLSVNDIEPGYHLVRASPDGLFHQTLNVSVNPGDITEVSFNFLTSEDQIPAMVRIGECVGTPQPSNLDGPAYSLHWISGNTLMAYFSGRDDGISCMASSDGIIWERMADACLDVPVIGGEFRTDPWVFLVPDGTYRMIFSKKEGNKHVLFSASSVDGIRFTGEDMVTFSENETASFPVNPSVPSGVVYANGIIRMYYYVPGIGIKSAISEDTGVSWISEDGIRIRYGTDPTTMLLPDGRTGIIYVDITPKSKGHRIFFSLSEDGYDFSGYQPVQILESIEPGVWLMDPEVITDEETCYLYFSLMGVEGMQNNGLPGTLRSVINLDCLEKLSTKRD